MKGRKIILSITSGFLIILFMIGSTGAVIVKHTCGSCGLADFHTEFYSEIHTHHACDCEENASSCSNHEEEAMEPGCCTFTSEKLSLSEYNKSSLINISVILLPVLSFQNLSSDEQLVKHTYPAKLQTKNGGEDVFISNCQLII